MNTRKKGTEYEEKAAEYLARNGVHIIERNYRNRRGEIDIIGKDGEYLVFFEVKYRKDDSMGDPAEAVNYAKQKNICRVAQYYVVTQRKDTSTPVRYDVIAVCGDELVWYKNAFEHIYR